MSQEKATQDIENSVASLDSIEKSFTTTAVGTGDVKAAAVAIQAANAKAKIRLTEQRIKIEQQDADNGTLVAQAISSAADSVGGDAFRAKEKVVGGLSPELRKLPKKFKHGPGETNDTAIEQKSGDFLEKMDNKSATEALKK
tara:strand:+ start:18641 stop:19066 length:426 start_codon:yes stop_codon:yes gene_type:complete